MRMTHALLDRDGTVVVDKHYLTDPDDLELLPQAAAGLRKLGDLGLRLLLVTNQSAVGRGMMEAGRLEAVHQRLIELLAEEEVSLAGIYVCPHLPEAGCRCRKPLPGLAEKAKGDHGFAYSRCLVVGDKACDVLMGRNINATTFLVRTGYGSRAEASTIAAATHVVDDLLEVAGVAEQMRGRAGS